MHMLWRADAAMGRIDIEDKVTGGEAACQRHSVITTIDFNYEASPGGLGEMRSFAEIKGASNSNSLAVDGAQSPGSCSARGCHSDGVRPAGRRGIRRRRR